MESKSLVSIIVAIYNIAPYLDEAIESVCKQSYKSMEIILVDDGSTDESPDICDNWAKSDSRIKVIHKANGGLSDARNAGLDMAQGEYVYFMDGDDTIAPELIDTAEFYMEQDNDLVVFQHHIIRSDGSRDSSWHAIGEYRIEDEQARKRFYIETLISGRIGWEAWNRMFRRDIIERYGLRFEDNRRVFAEDLYFSLCYCLHISKLESIDDRLYYYGVRDNSIMGVQRNNLNAGRMNELSKAVHRYFADHQDVVDLLDIFPILHYCVIQNVAERYKAVNHLTTLEMSKRILEDTEDRVYFRNTAEKLTHARKTLLEYYSPSTADYIIKIARLWQGKGKYDYACLTLMAKIKECCAKKQTSFGARKDISSGKRSIFYIGSETFGNLGDGMITEAIIAFCDKFFPDFILDEIPLEDYYNQKKQLLSQIGKGDMILLTGGGNLGDQYLAAQRLREDVITTWKDNPKIIFPQTIYYKDQDGEALGRDRTLFTADHNLVLFAREQRSCELGRKLFSCPVMCAPDIVLSMNREQNVTRENGVLFCMRDDKERSVDRAQMRRLIEIVKQKTADIDFTNLQLIYNGAKRSTRKREIEKKMDAMRKAGVVITDRLHGMVFAAITGTPCLVLSNSNHKVRGTYEWIRYLPYIRFINDVDEAEAALMDLLDMAECHYNNDPLMPYYDGIAETMRSLL